MIPRRYIEEWREFAPWPENGQVEQDLIIERTIVELFCDPFLNENFAPLPSEKLVNISFIPTFKLYKSLIAVGPVRVIAKIYFE